MPESPAKAVFLSYAREDAQPARRLAEALRAFGIEVWFDMSELRGGDVWDQKIRRQIKECALFMPLISTQSDQRGEGYFRLEWKLAVERTHLLADDRAFLFPVVVDDTRETDASVPEAFLRSQWTRLPAGEPTPQFIEQVKRLLDGPRKPAAGKSVAIPTAPAGAPAAKSGFPLWAAALLGVAVVGLGAVLLFRPPAKTEPPLAVTSTSPVTPPAPVRAAVNAKSIAVLPFSNMSEEKDSSFFSDGIQEDILTNLALISDLHVVSRTSVAQYRNTTKTVREIAQELGVAYVLEGSVRRAGNKVRVTGQLIRAATDEHVWAKAYDREMSDIFAIQGELATAIAGALQAAITPEQKTMIAGRATSNVEAYNLYLKARQLQLWSDVNRTTLPELEQLLQTAVRLDPNFVPAWVQIAQVNFRAYLAPSSGHDPQRLANAQAALAQAVRLAPSDPEVILAQGRGAFALNHLAEAKQYFERALQLAPGNVQMLIALGSLAGDQRLWPEAMRYQRRAQELDPRNPVVLWSSYNALLSLRQWEQAKANLRLLLELQPDSFDAAASLAQIPFLATGSRTEMEALLARLTPEQQKDPKVVAAKFNWYYHAIGDAKAYIALSDAQGTDLNFSDDDSTLQYTEALLVDGQAERALSLVRPVRDRLLTRAATDPENPVVLSSLSYAQALAGDKAEARATLDRLLALVRPETPLREQLFTKANCAIVYGWLGDKDKAVALMADTFLVPSQNTMSVHALRQDVDFFPLRGHPAWEALLSDPANQRPFAY